MTTEMDESAKQTAMVVPVHGRGRLLRGGKVGNKGGPGTVPSSVRAACRESFHKRRPILERIADGKVKEASVKERIAAIRTLGTYAGLEKSNVVRVASPEVKERWGEIYDHILNSPLIPDKESAVKLCHELAAIWGRKRAAE